MSTPFAEAEGIWNYRCQQVMLSMLGLKLISTWVFNTSIDAIDEIFHRRVRSRLGTLPPQKENEHIIKSLEEVFDSICEWVTLHTGEVFHTAHTRRRCIEWSEEINDILNLNRTNLWADTVEKLGIPVGFDDPNWK